MSQATRVGIGFDVHKLVRGRPLMLGGLHIESPLGLEGHSDGDVLLHAVTDALLGACGESDIGDFFPTDDPKWKGAESSTFLDKALAKLDKAGLVLNNVDTIIVAERPHLGAWKEGIRASLAGLLGLPIDRVCVKAKTNEGLGPVGKGEAIEAHAVVLLKPAKLAKRAAKKAKRPTKSRKTAKRKA
jgi:2-C-methyl-D-erythritol 2,4-cyclodiphosphate synthase